MTDINVINNDPYQIIIIGFDLILISLSILLGAYFSTRSPADRQIDLFKPLVGIFGLTLICFALVGFCNSNIAFVKNYINIFKIWIPNLLGLLSVFWSVLAVMRESNES